MKSKQCKCPICTTVVTLEKIKLRNSQTDKIHYEYIGECEKCHKLLRYDPKDKTHIMYGTHSSYWVYTIQN